MFAWSKFVGAWERQLGDPSRRASDVPNSEVLIMRAAYKSWRSTAAAPTADEWLATHVHDFERLGFYSIPKEGEIKIISPWTYDVWAFDRNGGWSALGDRFAGVRSFQLAAQSAQVTHAQPCGHAHETREAGVPCARAFATLSQPPVLTDREPGRQILIGQGELITLDAQRFQGMVALGGLGLLVPYEESSLTIPWALVDSYWLKESEERRVLQLQPPFGADWLVVNVVEFGGVGDEVWVEVLNSNAVVRSHSFLGR
ncbi:MAG: hypothetical protein WD556_06295 [Actinomycetota bacterium]